MIFNKQNGNSIIEFELCEDGELLIVITDDFTISNGCDFLLTQKELIELKEYFKKLDNLKS